MVVCFGLQSCLPMMILYTVSILYNYFRQAFRTIENLMWIDTGPLLHLFVLCNFCVGALAQRRRESSSAFISSSAVTLLGDLLQMNTAMSSNRPLVSTHTHTHTYIHTRGESSHYLPRLAQGLVASFPTYQLMADRGGCKAESLSLCFLDRSSVLSMVVQRTFICPLGCWNDSSQKYLDLKSRLNVGAT